MKKIAIFLIISSIVSCSAVRVNYDYDKETDFSSYTTYNYYPDMETGLSGLDTQRILVLIDSIMQVKGIKLSEEPDFYINIQSNAYRSPQNNAVGVGVGGTGRNVGGGITIGLPIGQPNIEREIRFDFVDSQKEFLFWEASSTSGFKESMSPDTREQKLREIVQKVFEKYPPKAN
tara:strand:+ start:69093 stop:69617 length:525 start_codon:yes stop_codon:yes gene_type:complete